MRRGPLSVSGLKNMIRRFELTGDLEIAPGEADAQLCEENRTLRPAFSTVTSTIGRRPLQEQFPNRQLIRTSGSCSLTSIRKEDLSVFFYASILAKSSSTVVVVV